ncbi:MAG: hypothetical protein ACOC4E_00470 [Patescibacteria group bacterium]
MRSVTTDTERSARAISDQLQLFRCQLKAADRKNPAVLQLLARNLLQCRKAVAALPGDVVQLWSVYQECEALLLHYQSKQ